MKVLMLGWELPPHHVGGMGIACYQMCRQLANSGVDIDFILPFEAKFDIKFMNVVSAVPSPASARGYLAGIYDSQYYTETKAGGVHKIGNMQFHQETYIENVTKLVKYGEYDVVHAHDWLTFRAGMAAKQATGMPLIAHVHATEYDRSGGGYGNPLVRDIEYNALMMADRVLAVSQNTKEVLVREYNIPASKIEVVHNSMDIEIEHLDDGQNEYVYLEQMKRHGYKVVVNAGRLTMQKGLTQFLQAAQKVIQKNPKTLFLIAGGGDQYLELLQMSADLGIANNVVFTGYLNGTSKRWRDAFKVADLFVMPSVNEPFGMAPIEAIGYGAPVLLTKQSGVSELLKNVLKVDFWDIDEMANQILAVVDNPALRDELYDNSYKEYLGLSWKKSADKMIGVYEQHLVRVGA